jgi:hypothetical protein
MEARWSDEAEEELEIRATSSLNSGQHSIDLDENYEVTGDGIEDASLLRKVEISNVAGSIEAHFRLSAMKVNKEN